MFGRMPQVAAPGTPPGGAFGRSAMSGGWRTVGLLLLAVVSLAGTTTGVGAAAKSGFRLALDPKSVTVGRGSTEAATILLTRVGSFAKPVSLSGSSRRGLTVSFSETPLVSDDTDVLVTANPTATLGSTTLTLTGKSGKTAVKVLIKVTVVATPTGGATAPTATPGASAKGLPATIGVPGTLVPNVLTITPSAPGSVTMTPQGGVATQTSKFEVSDVPAGVTATFAFTRTTATVTFTASPSAISGTYPMLVKASQNGVVYSSAALALTVSGATPAPTTAAPTSLAPTTVAGATTTTVAGPTTTTTASTTTAPPASTGVVIFARRISQAPRCAPAVSGPTVLLQITLSNSASTARSLSQIPPGSCTEVAFSTEFLVQPGSGLAAAKLPTGTILIARATDVPSRPIRAVAVVSSSLGAPYFDTGGTFAVEPFCSNGVVLGDGAGFTLADGEQRVFANVPPGTSCGSFDTAYGTPRDGSRTTNDGKTGGPIIAFARPASCPVPTASTPLPGPAGCYAEITYVD